MYDGDLKASGVTWLLEQNGYSVVIRRDGPTYQITATHETEPTRKLAGTDGYGVLCEIAEQCGMELDDG